MQKLKTLLFLTAILCGIAGPMATPARAEISFSFFYNSLDPYGDWVDVGGYGNCWRPRDVSSDWSPYTDGYWGYTDAGWTWISYEDYGDIVYHYGRWVFLDDGGWVWVPGYEWGPAWVSWRSNDDCVGWAPLPPEARWRPSVGFSVWVDRDFDIGPRWFNFISVRDFGAPSLRRLIFPRARNVTIINRTTNITNITVNNVTKVVYNGGPNFAFINGHSRRPVERFRLERNINANNNTAIGNFRNVRRGDRLVVNAPSVSRDDNARPARIAQKFEKARVNKGWDGVKDNAERDKIREHIRKDAGDSTADKLPAKQVDAAQVERNVQEGITQQTRKGRLQKEGAAGNESATQSGGNTGNQQALDNEKLRARQLRQEEITRQRTEDAQNEKALRAQKLQQQQEAQAATAQKRAAQHDEQLRSRKEQQDAAVLRQQQQQQENARRLQLQHQDRDPSQQIQLRQQRQQELQGRMATQREENARRVQAQQQQQAAQREQILQRQQQRQQQKDTDRDPRKKKKDNQED
jgi:hypothetical protein